MNILVTHPGRQHSHQLARALLESDMLAGYWTGVPTAPPASKGMFYQTLARWSPQDTLDLPEEVLRHFYVEPVVRRLAEKLCTRERSIDLQHRAMAWFDRWCAWRLPDDIDAVVCYENAALQTFQEAKKQGHTTILDAASFHYEYQDAVYEPVESEAVHTRITAHKDREIALADHIFTVSDLARETYLEAGVPDRKVSSVPMGTDVSHFSLLDVGNNKSEKDIFTFLLVGHADRRKGADVLLRASRMLQESNIQHEIWVAGHVDEEIFSGAPSTVKRLGYLSHGELKEVYRGANVLVLPSRFDSFGRVVVEGMAMGLPALVSENVGAKEVLSEGQNGWVVPAEDPQALAEQMQWCIAHPEQVAAMQEPANAAAQEYTWSAYRRRAVRHVKQVADGSSNRRRKIDG